MNRVLLLSLLILPFCCVAVSAEILPESLLPDDDPASSSADDSASAPVDSSGGKASPATSKPEFRWKEAAKDSMVFLLMQNGARFAIQDKTRDALTGPFMKDYFDTLKHKPAGFWDDDSFATNLILHPIQGSATYHIARHNGASKTQAFWWGVAYSTNFELGPLGEAGIGNVRLSPVDLVVTPSVGFLLGTTEEWLLSKLSGKTGFLPKLARFALAGRTFSQFATGRQSSVK